MELFAHIQELEKDISCLSSSVLAKEMDSMRKELEKTKLKLKETEFKLRNVVQEKTKLEVCYRLQLRGRHFYWYLTTLYLCNYRVRKPLLSESSNCCMVRSYS